MQTPSVTVIIPALNAARTLGLALDSLASQSVPYEAILVDGGSRDETLAIAAAAPWLRTISAPGTSIYEALNRGIEEASAPAIALLNADDTLLPGAFEAWLAALDRAPQAGIARGWATFVETGRSGLVEPIAEADRRCARPLNLELLLRGACTINSLCIRRSVFDRLGSFDTTSRLAADREWMLRSWIAKIGIEEIERPVYRYLAHDESSTIDRAKRNFATVRRENIAIAERYISMLSSPRISGELVGALRRWHAAETAMLALQDARTGNWVELIEIAGRAFRIEPMWPFAALGEFILWLRKKVA